MRKLCLYISILTMSLGELFGQTDNELPKNSMQVYLGGGFQGTDNVWGIGFSAEYTHYFHKKLNYTAFIGTTMDDGMVPVRFWNGTGEVVDGEVKFTTAGIQTGLTLGYSFYRSKRHHIQGSLGVFFRYQTTSNPEILGLYTTYPYPPSLGYESLSTSFSFGGVAAFSYEYTFENSVFLTGRGWIQYDANDDALNMFSIGIGKRF
jgi:hypothetical protein